MWFQIVSSEPQILITSPLSNIAGLVGRERFGRRNLAYNLLAHASGAWLYLYRETRRLVCGERRNILSAIGSPSNSGSPNWAEDDGMI